MNAADYVNEDSKSATVTVRGSINKVGKHTMLGESPCICQIDGIIIPDAISDLRFWDR